MAHIGIREERRKASEKNVDRVRESRLGSQRIVTEERENKKKRKRRGENLEFIKEKG